MKTRSKVESNGKGALASSTTREQSGGMSRMRVKLASHATANAGDRFERLHSLIPRRGAEVEKRAVRLHVEQRYDGL